MADEIRKVIEVDVSGAIDSLEDMREEVESSGYAFKSLGDAKKYIDRLRASLIDLDETSEEYADRVAEIDTVQDKLNKAMKVTGSSLKNAEGSYNALSKKMSELKKAFKETNDEAERKALAKQIVGINDQLKEMDASIGNYQRNVGNYEAAFTKGLAGISKNIEALGNPLAIAKNGVIALGNAFKALILNPVGAVIMAIVVAIKALKKGFEQSEEATNSLKRAFSSFQPVMNAISNVFTGFAKIVGSIAEKAIPALVTALQKAGEWMLKLLNKIGIVSDERLEAYRQSIEAQKEAMRVTQELTEKEIALVERKRKFQVDEAKGEMQVAELRAKAADKDKYSAEERQKFLEQAIGKERALNATRLSIAQEEYNILKEKASLTDNDAAMNDALAASQANLYNVKREYYEKERSLKKELQRVNGELEKSEEDLTDAEKKALDEADKTKEADLKKIEEIQHRAELSMLSGTDKELAILKERYEEEKALFEAYEKDTVKLTEEYERQVAEAKASKGEGDIKDLDEEAVLQQYIADKTIQNEFEKKERLLEIDRERLEGQKAIYEELMGLDDLSAEKKEEYANKLEEINAGLVDNANQTKEVQKEQALDLVNTYSKVAEGIGNIMDNIASIWQESIKQRVKNGKITEEQGKKEFENTKKLQIATAIINGLAGVATAVSTAMSLGPIAGPIMAAVNSALVITTTALQIAKINSTSFDGGGAGSLSADVSSAAATPSPAAVEYTPQYSTNITGESETVNLANAVNEGQRDQRVYVVESDINEAGRRVEVRESESTF